MNEKLPQSLRLRLNVLIKEVIALNSFDQPIQYNRLSGAVFHQLLNEQNAHLKGDDAVNLAVHLTCKENLADTLAKYDEVIRIKAEQSKRQVRGIVKNMIPEELENRDQLIEDTLAMLGKFPLVRSITGIRKLVKARIDAGHVDLDEEEYMYLS